MMYKSIWVAGMARAGSMWTYNVVRELLRRAGHRVLPDEIPLSDQASLDYVNREFACNRGPGVVYVLKVHAYLKDLPPDAFVITNIRDIRDALLSFMRFMHVDFDKAFETAKASSRLASYYANLPDHRRLILHYEELTARPEAVVEAIAHRLGLTVDQKTVTAITNAFSKERIRSQIEERDERCLGSVARTGLIPEGEILLKRANGHLATIDRSTGFQSNHVSDSQDGDWRNQLSSDQIAVLQRTFSKWLMRHGFEV